MKRVAHITNASQRHRRRGSTLLVVLALLGLLALLGFTFYTFAAQERQAAEYFAGESRVTSATSQPEGIFEWPLRQLILGPDDANYNSVLWGGRFSLVPGMLGRDGIPFNGEGINVAVDPSGNPIIDMNYDGTGDNPNYLNFVDAPSANNGMQWGTGKSMATLPAPDTDYSSPDINNMALSYDGLAIDGLNMPSRVIIPSFLRPQYLRNAGAPIPAWYDNSGLVPASSSFRPHRDHYYIDLSGNSTNIKRYVLPSEAAGLGLGSGFSFQPLDASGGVTNGDLGVWSNPATPLAINLDVDTDGDGIRDAILLDLGYAPFRRGDGKLVVPLFAFQVRDLNGLLNLNTSNSTSTKALLPPDLTSQEFGADITGAGRYLGSSNQGHTAAEINAIYGLTTDPTDPLAVSASDTLQYRCFLKALGADRAPMNAREVANLEWFFLTYGRPHFNVQLGLDTSTPATAAGMAPAIESVTPGLLGDVDVLLNLIATGSGALPQAGVVGYNDNLDSTSTYPFIWTSSSAVPQLGTPLDLMGNGSPLQSNLGGLNPLGKKLNLLDRSAQPAIGPNRWLIYQGYHSNTDVSLLSSTYAAQLMPPMAPVNQLTDDATELVVDPDAVAYAKLPAQSGTQTANAVNSDAIFGPLETAFLQQSNADGSMARASSRIANLIPLNSTASSNSANIRSQYTTVSSDRREFSKPTPDLGSASTQMRAWENTYMSSIGPFRSVVWYHMSGTSPLSSKQFRLSANQLLVDGTGEPFPAGSPTSLMFRDLTPHPSQTVGLPSAAVPTGPLTYPGPTGLSAGQQEYFARRDRQAMARDIYVLLYLYCGGTDVDPLTTPNTPPGPVHTLQHLKEMAQFAVNYVDAMDRDSVMTRFEYDTDLSDGWGMDDNPYTTVEPNRREVWGVEAQQLTISEALVIKTNQLTSNNSTTSFDDATARFFTYVDLQSTSPYPINFASNRAWQVRVLPSGPGTGSADERRVTPRVGSIPAGGVFTIMSSGDGSTRDGSGNPTSNFVVNNVTVAPTVTLASTSRLDLVVDPPANFDLTDGASPPVAKTGIGELLGQNNTPPDPVSVKLPVIFQLMRRADPYRMPPASAAEEADNPWIEVDRMQTGDSAGTESGIKILNTTNTTDATSVVPLLRALKSHYRYEPFAADAELDFPDANEWGNATTAPLHNFIGSGKYNQAAAPPVATLSQFHFDRPFASLGELLEIPVVGPGLYSSSDLWYDMSETWYLTRALGHANQSPYNQVNLPASRRALTAYAKFMQADFPDSIDPNPQLDNRWYRLLEFLEVPSPMHRHLELHNYSTSQLGLPTNFGWPRIHGQINLNMLRHSNALAGLLDDSLVLNTQVNSIPSRDSLDTVPSTGATRDWWFEFLKSRDGVINPAVNPIQPSADPLTGLFVPGVAGSRPFRGFNFTARGQNSQKQDTLFRVLQGDAAVPDPRSMFEVGQQAEHNGGSTPIDSYSKNRLLSKILNNVTTRTNSFGVFIAVQYFEAAEETSGGNTAIRIGGRLDDTPTQRGFFVIDRTGAVEQWKNLATLGITPISSSTFSITPNTSTSGVPNGISWQQLVLYKQILN